MIRRQVIISLFGETEPAAGELKTLANQLCDRTRGVHAGPEVGVVVTLAAHGANLRHDMGRALREMLSQPFAEQVLHLPGHSQDGVAGERRARRPGGLEH